jgi:hypothetical protein
LQVLQHEGRLLAHADKLHGQHGVEAHPVQMASAPLQDKARASAEEILQKYSRLGGARGLAGSGKTAGWSASMQATRAPACGWSGPS